MRCLLIISVLYCLTACVSKKKYDKTVLDDAAQRRHLKEQIDLLGLELQNREIAIDSLNILYAEQRGANEVLLLTQDKLQDRLDEVQNQVVEAHKSKTSTAQDLQAILKGKEELIQQKEEHLQMIKQTIEKQEKEYTQLLGEFSAQLEGYGPTNYKIKIVNGELRISLAEGLFFRTGQARVRTEGISNLAIIAGLINKYPSIKIQVIGNLDNKKIRGFKDNLELTALRAVNVVRVLTNEYGVSPSRVLAGGKGEFAPVASNETAVGRTDNRRLDFIISTRLDRLVKDIGKSLEEE